MDFVEMKGYDALRNGAAWVDLSGRGKIKVLGEDRARLLHAMTTNHIQQLTPGTGCYAFFLTTQGRILADANVLCRPDHFLLDVEPETREKVYQHLDHYIIADDVTLEDVTDSMATIAVEGPKAAEVLPVTPGVDYGNEEWGNRLVVRLSPTSFLVFAPDKAELIAQLKGVEAADSEAYNVVRIEEGRARYGEDLSERFLAQEANQPRALHFSKGCYLGQEIVERVRSRGQIHRVLKPLVLEMKDPPAPGTKLTQPEPVEITSAAYSPALDKVVALGYVRV